MTMIRKNMPFVFLAAWLFAFLFLPAPSGAQDTQPLTSKLNITTGTVVKPAQGVLVTFNVTVAGAAGAVYDTTTTGAAAAGNQIAVIPAVVGTYYMQFPFLNGLVVVPGAAQVVSVSYK
jgi:hypothetical protein